MSESKQQGTMEVFGSESRYLLPEDDLLADKIVRSWEPKIRNGSMDGRSIERQCIIALSIAFLL